MKQDCQYIFKEIESQENSFIFQENLKLFLLLGNISVDRWMFIYLRIGNIASYLGPQLARLSTWIPRIFVFSSKQPRLAPYLFDRGQSLSMQGKT